MTNLILKGEAGFHCQSKHNVGRLYSRSGEEEQGVRRLHNKGGIIPKDDDGGDVDDGCDDELFVDE